MLSTRADSGDNALSDFQYYYYKPSMAAAVIFIILFGVASGLHLFQMIKTRTWFMIPFIIGAIMETIGYIGRALSANENPGPYTLGPYIIQTLFLLISPALLAASIYMELGRIVLMIDGDRALFIRRTWLTKIFVAGDVFSFLMQSSGGGLMAGGDSGSINTGKTIVVAGLFVQIIFFGLFVIAAMLFNIRMNQMPTPRSYEVPFWKKHMMSLYIVSILIFVRSIIRVVEYLQGYDGYIMAHEAFLYVFDGLVMWVAVATMNWIHPGEVAREVRAQKSGRATGAVDQNNKDGVRMDYVPV